VAAPFIYEGLEPSSQVGGYETQNSGSNHTRHTYNKPKHWQPCICPAPGGIIMKTRSLVYTACKLLASSFTIGLCITATPAFAGKVVTLIEMGDLHGTLVPHAAVLRNSDGDEYTRARSHLRATTAGRGPAVLLRQDWELNLVSRKNAA